MQSGTRPGDRQVAILVSVAVGIVVAVITIATFWWIYELVTGPDRRAAAVLAVATYDPAITGTQIITKAAENVPPEGDKRLPWLGTNAWVTAVQAGQTYIQQFPQPQNAQVLTGMNTSQIWGFMVQQVSPALGVSCQYCHDITNFAAETFPQKARARGMLKLVADLNTQFMVTLPDWRSNFVRCATCHNGQPTKMMIVGPQFVNSVPPIRVTVDPIDAMGNPVITTTLKPAGIQNPLLLQDAALYYLFNYKVWNPYDAATPESGRGSLALTYKGGRTQDQVTINQNTMNNLAWSLGVGCIYCHNTRNFISYEPTGIAAPLITADGETVQVATRLKAVRMLQMTTWISDNWTNAKYNGANPTVLTEAQMAQIGTGGLIGRNYYRLINDQYYNMPGCFTCHAGVSIPKAALNQSQIPLDATSADVVLPTRLRGGL